MKKLRIKFFTELDDLIFCDVNRPELMYDPLHVVFQISLFRRGAELVFTQLYYPFADEQSLNYFIPNIPVRIFRQSCGLKAP